MKPMKLTICMLLALGALAGTLRAAETLSIDGSTTVGPIGDAFSEAFMKKYPELKITVKKTGSGDGAAALVDGRCEIAMMSRFMKPTEFKKAVVNDIFPVAHAIAMDGVCMVVHPSNPVTALTRAQVRDIYSGKISNWKELGGADKPIIAISRDTSSGTYEVFVEKVMGKEKLAGNVEYVNANPQAHARCKATEGAIAFVGLGFVDTYVKALKIDNVMPSRGTIAKGTYPISRPLFLFTNGYPELGTRVFEFCTYYLSEEGQQIIEAKGYIPVTNY